MIGKIEQGERTPSEQLVGACEALPELGANVALRELRDHLKEHFRKRPYPGWFDRCPDAEANAQMLPRTATLERIEEVLKTWI
jgi:hypothetical protein